MESAFAELQEFLRLDRKDWYNSSPLLQHIIRRTLDLYGYKQNYKEYERVKLFEIAYKAALFQLESGIDLEAYPHPSTLIENSQPAKRYDAPESVKLAAEVFSDLRAMLNDKPAQKPLTAADREDLEKLERIKNGEK